MPPSFSMRTVLPQCGQKSIFKTSTRIVHACGKFGQVWLAAVKLACYVNELGMIRLQAPLRKSIACLRAMSSGIEGPKLWGGRFSGKTDPLMESTFVGASGCRICSVCLVLCSLRHCPEFNNSMPFDKRMWSADIRGSVEYAAALARCSIISEAERDALISGLDKV